MNTLAVNLRTGRPVKWPKHPYETGTDHAEFNCVYEAQHYRLASGAAHRREKVPSGTSLLIDSRWQTKLVPTEKVHISHRI